MKNKIDLMLNYRIVFAIAFVFINFTTNASENYSKKFIEKISSASIKLHCEDEAFLKKTGFGNQECITLLSKYSKSCNLLLEPFIPNINDEKKQDEINVKIFRNLGEMYSLCLLGTTFQNIE